MSWTSEWMNDWLQQGGKRRTQNELAKLAETDPANISRWINGQVRPDRDAIERLAGNLGGDDGTGLAVAWLKDQIPASARAHIRIESSATRLAEDSGERFPEGISASLRKRLVFFGHLAVENPSIRKIIDVCYDAARRTGS